MPYDIQKVGSKFRVMNLESGSPTAKRTSKTKAEAQIRLLRAIEHGYVPRQKKR